VKVMPRTGAEWCLVDHGVVVPGKQYVSSRRRRLFLLTPLTWAVPAIFGRPVRGQARNAIETQTSAPSSQPEPYLTSDSGIGGPNAYSMVDGLNLPWPSRTPWIDADGIAGGTKPYASH